MKGLCALLCAISGEIALINNHYYYYYLILVFVNILFINEVDFLSVFNLVGLKITCLLQ